ncbi:MAG: DegT/DnrJ/EryC1/StrS family aminotransferase [Candidatus Sumerlaeota bacterium]|nr:DegT/DnrJ/EryC1/StrS family aminotransferase [Candidatus Sumerlaeota bacterium]
MKDSLAVNGGAPVRTAPFPPRRLIGEEEKSAVIRLFDETIARGGVIGYGGPRERQYEQDFEEFMGGGFAHAVSSGTAGLYAALGGLQIDALSEIIVPPITDPGGVMPVALLGCVPVVADADPRSYNISAEQIEAVLTERTRAIIIAHISGEPADMDPIMDLARSRGLYVIEDCAQSPGALYKGRLVGSIGHVAAFSTMWGKHYCTGGVGGVVFTRDEDLHWRVRRFSDRGKPINLPGIENNVVAGLNCNLGDLSAAIGIEQLKKLPEFLRRRRQIAQVIRTGLSDSRGVSIGWQVPGSQSAYWKLRLRLEFQALTVDKVRCCKALVAAGIPCEVHYRFIACEMPWFVDKAVFGHSGFPWNCSDYHGPQNPRYGVENAIRVDAETFKIPIHENWGEQEVRDVIAALKKVEEAYGRKG